MDYVAILQSALSKPVIAERSQGACRVYVSVGAEHAKKMAAAAKKLNKDFQKKTYYGTSNAIYIGYDNFDGKALAQGAAVVEALQAAGIQCYRDEQGD